MKLYKGASPANVEWGQNFVHMNFFPQCTYNGTHVYKPPLGKYSAIIARGMALSYAFCIIIIAMQLGPMRVAIMEMVATHQG